MTKLNCQWDEIPFEEKALVKKKIESDLGTLLLEETKEVKAIFNEYIPNETLNDIITDMSGKKLHSFFCAIPSYNIEYNKF